MIIPDADRTHAYQINADWGAAVHLLEVHRVSASGAYRLLLHQSVSRAVLAESEDRDVLSAELEHLCRLSGWRPSPEHRVEKDPF